MKNTNKYRAENEEEWKKSDTLRRDVYDALTLHNKTIKIITNIIFFISGFLLFNCAWWFVPGVVALFFLKFVELKIGNSNMYQLYDLTKARRRFVDGGWAQCNLVLSYKYECLRTATCIIRYMILWVSVFCTCLYLHFHPMPFYLHGFV